MPPSGLSKSALVDFIFGDAVASYGLTEFTDIPPAEEILDFREEPTRVPGSSRYSVKCLKRGTWIQVASATKSNPEEIVRQLWLYKLNIRYGYPWDRISVEHPVRFGGGEPTKSADVLVTLPDLLTPKLIVETKRPKRKEGVAQLKSYLNAEGSPIGVWSNGIDRLILYRRYPDEFDDTLTDLPRVDQTPDDLSEARRFLAELRVQFDFKQIIQNLEELILANSGYDEFNEIFKLLFAKLLDETLSRDNEARALEFRKGKTPDVTYTSISALFDRAKRRWPTIFDDADQLKLTPVHLHVVVGPMETVRLLGASIRVMDDAFEYLMPTVAKRKNGQFFTPRYVIDMCIKILRPRPDEYVLDPACGSGGFLLHTMQRQYGDGSADGRRGRYAAEYLWGFDFDERSAKIARAIMLIAGDGRSHMYKVNSLDPREWYRDQEGESLRAALRQRALLENPIGANIPTTEADAWSHWRDLKFDVILTNPPFAGEIRDKSLLTQYRLPRTRPRGRVRDKEERDLLFVERCLDMLRPGGRIAIVLPQGKFNNPSLSFMRRWISDRAQVLAVVGLHPNTFKPHTGTKTSVLFLRKYSEDELHKIGDARAQVQSAVPDVIETIRGLLALDSDEAIYDAMPASVELAISDLWDESDESETLASSEDAISALELELQSLAGMPTLRGRREAQRRRKIEVELDDLYFARASSSLRAQLQYVLGKPDLVELITKQWTQTLLSDRLNYAVFMATSTEGGKDSSGDYEYRRTADKRLILDPDGAPIVKQDCIQYFDFEDDGIAEAFLKWSSENGMEYGRAGS